VGTSLGAGAAARATLAVAAGSRGMGSDWVPVLAEVALFEGLSKRHLRRVAALARTRRFAPGAAILRAGEAGSAFYVILDGAVRIVPESGRALVLRTGDSFGEMSLLDDAPRSADALAEGEVQVMSIGRGAFDKLLRSEPAIARALLRTLAARLRAQSR
jgi:CRP/FNR family cyclic AMP-dependent transcriptional regulator